MWSIFSQEVEKKLLPALGKQRDCSADCRKQTAKRNFWGTGIPPQLALPFYLCSEYTKLYISFVISWEMSHVNGEFRDDAFSAHTKSKPMGLLFNQFKSLIYSRYN